MDEHLDSVAVSSQGLVDGIVDDLVDEMVKARLSGRADVHRRTHTNRFESFKDLNVAGVVFLGILFCFVCHL